MKKQIYIEHPSDERLLEIGRGIIDLLNGFEKIKYEQNIFYNAKADLYVLCITYEKEGE